MIHTRRARAVNALRATYGRLTRGRLDARAGYVYAWRRAVAHKLQRASEAGPGPHIDEIELDTLESVVAGSRLHELEPADAIPFMPPPVHTTRRWLLRGVRRKCESHRCGCSTFPAGSRSAGSARSVRIRTP